LGKKSKAGVTIEKENNYKETKWGVQGLRKTDVVGGGKNGTSKLAKRIPKSVK